MPESGNTFRYLAIYNEMLEKITSGQWRAGTKLPNELELMEQYGVSRGTIRNALGKLERNSLVSRRKAIGTFVKFRKIDYTLYRMECFSEQMHRIHVEPSSELLSIRISTDPSPEILQALQMNARETVYAIERIRKADGDPMAYEIAHVPQSLCPDLHAHLTEKASLYDIYERIYGHRLKCGYISMEAELANMQTQRILNLKKDTPVLKMLCIVTLQNERPLYYVVCYYVGDKYKFSTVLPR